jgi:hypothetical protein
MHDEPPEQVSWQPEPQSSLHGALELHETVHTELQLNVQAAPFLQLSMHWFMQACPH